MTSLAVGPMLCAALLQESGGDVAETEARRLVSNCTGRILVESDIPKTAAGSDPRAREADAGSGAVGRGAHGPGEAAGQATTRHVRLAGL